MESLGRVAHELTSRLSGNSLRKVRSYLFGAIAVLTVLPYVHGQQAQDNGPSTTTTVACSSKAGERQHCSANTSFGVVLVKSTGTLACLLGKTWGYDESGIWVMDGCSGEFSVVQKGSANVSSSAITKAPEYFGSYTPGRGLKVANTEHGDLNIRVYTYVRYLNQKQLDGTYTNAFGQTSTSTVRAALRIFRSTR